METYRRRNPASRQRLGEFMAAVSRFHTIAGATDLLDQEVSEALRGLAELPPSVGPVAFGRGSAHAFGRPSWPYFKDEDARRRAVAVGQEKLFELFETELLVGPPDRLPANGVARPTPEYGRRQLAFEMDTARRLQEWGHTSDRAHRIVLAQEARDVVEPVNRMAPWLGLDSRRVFADLESLTGFMLSLPAKGAVCRMRMTGHENPRFRWDVGDLNDITALGTAAAYCDVVVAENHWGSVLRRHAPELYAHVVTDVTDLRGLLA